MVRGLKNKYDSVRYLSWTLFSNMPWFANNYWIPDLAKMAQEKPNEHFFMSSTIWDNVKVFGKDVIEKIKEVQSTMNPLVWKIEYMNEKNAVLDNAFYHKFNDNKHLYVDDIDGTDPLHNLQKELRVSFDFNKVFNSAVVSQLDRNILSTQMEFYAYANEDYTQVAYMIDAYYSPFQIKKEIWIYGDQDGNDRTDQNGETFFDNIVKILRSKGWHVVSKKEDDERNPEHIVKHYQINSTLSENKDEGIRLKINADRCPYLVLSIKNAQRLLKDGKKDKSSEAKLKGEDRRLATDLSDCWDYQIVPVIEKDFVSTDHGFDIDFV